jgi:hypothetical protein
MAATQRVGCASATSSFALPAIAPARRQRVAVAAAAAAAPCVAQRRPGPACGHAAARGPPPARSSPEAASSSSSPGPPAELEGDGPRAAWADAAALLLGAGLTEEEAHRCVGRAYGWATQAYWRSDKVKETPDAGHVAEVLAYLGSLGVADDGLRRAVKQFPELLACDVAGRLAPNVARMQAEGLRDGVLAAAIARRPAVLGFKVDCAGNCAGQCSVCWSTF